MKGRHLGEFEELVLLTVGILYDAYGLAIMDKLSEQTKRKLPPLVYLGLQHLRQNNEQKKWELEKF